MTINVLGLSHNSAPLDVREHVAFSTEQLRQALPSLIGIEGVDEAMILSTCNRTELYYDAINSEVAAAQWLAREREVAPELLQPHLYALSNENAVRHVLRVASGLDSMVVGETQILGQMKMAYRSAISAGTMGVLLNRLLQFSFSTAKLVRSQTEVGDAPLSVAYIAIKLAAQIHDDLSRKTALLIGAGETIELVATHLAAAGIGRMIISNRTLERAQHLGKRFAAETVDFAHLMGALPQADIVVASTASEEPIITASLIELAMKKRRLETMFVVDLAVPRDVEPAVGALDGVYLYTIDDLKTVADSNLGLRQSAALEAEELVRLQVGGYMDWLRTRANTSLISQYRALTHEIQEHSLEEAMRSLHNGTDAESVLTELAHKLANRLTHQPTKTLREVGNDVQELELARRVLGLDGDREE
ncbi:MAG: glutamyl-tRNA reductase [Pseudomonadota bacterium]